MRNGTLWTEQESDLLRMLWKLGYTAGYIAARLGKSRNSIIGRAHRLGLAGRASPIKRRAA